MKTLLGLFLTDTHIKEANLELNHSIYRQAIQHAKKLGLDKIYHLGDVFDSRQSQTIQLLKDGFLDILDEFKREDMKLVGIAGNHDRIDYSSKHSYLTIFQHHPSFELIEEYEYRQVSFEVILHFIPFFTDSIYNKYLQETHKNTKNKSFKHILCSHIGISGAIMNNGSIVESGVEQSYVKEFDKVLLGHYHDEQQYGNIHYIGSSLQHNFGESSNKGLTVLYDDLSVEKLPLDFPKYTTFYISAKDVKTKDVQELKKEKESSGDNLRIILEGTKEEVDAFNKQELLNIGVKVEKKSTKIEKREVEKNVERYDVQKLKNYFVDFCKENSLSIEEGRVYINQL